MRTLRQIRYDIEARRAFGGGRKLRIACDVIAFRLHHLARTKQTGTYSFKTKGLSKGLQELLCAAIAAAGFRASHYRDSIVVRVPAFDDRGLLC